MNREEVGGEFEDYEVVADRRAKSAMAAAVGPVLTSMFFFVMLALDDGTWGMIGLLAVVAMTGSVCSGPLMFLPGGWCVGVLSCLGWMVAVRYGRIGDWGWRQHLWISITWCAGFGLLLALLIRCS
ncbi:MAG: hypothetical protein JNL28_12520 [Planctomycetes bacterium]|nr:hypothetical protein [Planctomycetota bacterium]